MRSNNGLAASLYKSRKSVPEIFGESCGTKLVVSGPAVADADRCVKNSRPCIRQDDIVPVATEKLLLPRARRPIPLPRRKRASRAVPLCDACTQWRGPRKIIRRPCDPNTYLSLSLLLRHYRRCYRYIWNCYHRIRSYPAGSRRNDLTTTFTPASAISRRN